MDVLLQHSHAEYQEMLNYWKQISHVMKYFRAEEDPRAKVPDGFMSNFLEVRSSIVEDLFSEILTHTPGKELDSLFVVARAGTYTNAREGTERAGMMYISRQCLRPFPSSERSYNTPNQ